MCAACIISSVRCALLWLLIDAAFHVWTAMTGMRRRGCFGGLGLDGYINIGENASEKCIPHFRNEAFKLKENGLIGVEDAPSWGGSPSKRRDG